MSTTPGVRVRPRTGQSGALLQVRLAPDLRREIVDTARENGLSTSYYVEALIKRLIDEGDGQLPTFEESNLAPLRQQQDEGAALRKSA